ncbi:uncharacterized protein [Elaeis guineensis]|uniref:uncharacterized protein isoform X2 n=1 Tax=Elaeis guineensis var. tenera TaxID=51953 RepID=UPI003C6CFE61
MPYPNQVLEVVRPIQRLLTAKKQQSVDWWFDEGGTFNFDEEGHCLEAVFQWIEDHNTETRLSNIIAALQYQRFTKTITRCLGFSGD